MNWVKNMNDALEYIEENINKDVTSEEVAEVALSSKFHFLRIFNILTGMTVGEYIRKRRLSLAAKDIVSSDMKIIDIAHKYGYETPEAFTKAFKKLHNITPSKARKREEILKAIPPISFQITVKGEKRMDYKIVKKEGFKIAGISKKVTTKNDENFNQIPKFWNEICSNGTIDILNKSAKKSITLGVCYDFNKEQEEFSYMIGVQGENINGIDDYDIIDIPQYSWAVFESVGPLPEALQNVIKKIFSEWFPATQYQHAGGPEIEVYLPGNPSTEDYKCEVWIPIVEKA